MYSKHNSSTDFADRQVRETAVVSLVNRRPVNLEEADHSVKIGLLVFWARLEMID